MKHLLLGGTVGYQHLRKLISLQSCFNSDRECDDIDLTQFRPLSPQFCLGLAIWHLAYWKHFITLPCALQSREMEIEFRQ